jgi:hypothetical protein
MGKIKELATDPPQFFFDDSDSYLTMASLCNEEWDRYIRKHVWGKSYTGGAELAIKSAFQAGFFAGFEAKFFKQLDN